MPQKHNHRQRHDLRVRRARDKHACHHPSSHVPGLATFPTTANGVETILFTMEFSDMTSLPFVTAFPMFYYVFKDNARIYGGFTQAQKGVTMVGLVFYVLGLCLYVGAIAVCMASDGPECRRVHPIPLTSNICEKTTDQPKRCLANFIPSSGSLQGFRGSSKHSGTGSEAL